MPSRMGAGSGSSSQGLSAECGMTLRTMASVTAEMKKVGCRETEGQEKKTEL